MCKSPLLNFSRIGPNIVKTFTFLILEKTILLHKYHLLWQCMHQYTDKLPSYKESQQSVIKSICNCNIFPG